MKYKLVTNSYNKELESEVNNLLEKGWELYGQPFSQGMLEYDHLSQALVKWDENETITE